MTIGREEVKNRAGQNTEKPWQSKNKVKTNARVRVNASKVNGEAVLHTCIPSIFPTPRNPPEERRRQLAFALLR